MGGRPPPTPAASALLFVDVVDDLGHVLVVLAELGGILNDRLILLFLARLGPDDLFLDRLAVIARLRRCRRRHPPRRRCGHAPWPLRHSAPPRVALRPPPLAN